GYCCIGLPGVWAWQKRRDDRTKPRELLPDLAALDWKDRKVYVVFDSDAAIKSDVRAAERCLAEGLATKGAIVKVVRLPPGPAGTKFGLDDFLAAHDVSGDAREALDKLIAAAAPPDRAPGKSLCPVPPFVPFPTGALPSPLGTFVEQTAAAM